MDFQRLALKALTGESLTRQEAPSVLAATREQLPELLDATLRVREHHFGRRVKLCVLLNAQSGICPEDCHYCSQSKISTAPVEKYRLLPEEAIVQRAAQAAATGATRFCIVIAARGPRDRDIQHLTQAVTEIKAQPATGHMEICTSLGLLSLEQCQQLKQSGVDYVNHNLNTSESHYPAICSTHTYADRLATLHNIQQAGLHTCSGGIVGMGEQDEDIIDLALSLREMEIESIPINFLLAIKGTPLQDEPAMDADRGLKVLCLMRLLNPDKEIRMAAGRETHLKERQAQALCAANSLFVNGYLTTPGDPAAEVRAWVEEADFMIEEPACAGASV